MTEPAPPPTTDASVEEIEADMEARRERLAASVDALADKVDVKARAQEKVDRTRQQAQEKVDRVMARGAGLLNQARQARWPLPLAVVAVPALVLGAVIIARVRRRS